MSLALMRGKSGALAMSNVVNELEHHPLVMEHPCPYAQWEVTSVSCPLELSSPSFTQNCAISKTNGVIRATVLATDPGEASARLYFLMTDTPGEGHGRLRFSIDSSRRPGYTTNGSTNMWLNAGNPNGLYRLVPAELGVGSFWTDGDATSPVQYLPVPFYRYRVGVEFRLFATGGVVAGDWVELAITLVE